MIDPVKFTKELFPFLTLGEATKILKECRLLHKNRGDILINQCDLNYSAFFILSGLARAYCINDEGEERTILFKSDRQFIGSIPTIIYDQPAAEVIEVMEDSTILQFDFRTFRNLSKNSLTLNRAYTSMIEDMLQDAIYRIHDFVVLNPEQRYIKFTKDCADLIQRIPLKYIASFIGITIPSLSRIRKRLAQVGN